MVFDLLGSIIGAGANLAASKSAANAQRETNATNKAINQQNLAAREKERQDAIRQAMLFDAFMRENYGDVMEDYQWKDKRSQSERDEYKKALEHWKSSQEQGITSAGGATTKYIPGRGWVSSDPRQAETDTLRDEAASLAREEGDFARDQMGEVRRQIAEERPLVTAQMQRNFARQGREGDQADAYLEDLRGLQREDPDAFASMLYAQAARGANEAYDATESRALRDAMRTGGEAGKVVEAAGRGRAKALSDARLDSAIKARGVTEGEYQNRRNALANLYSGFAGRASATPQIQQFAPVSARTPSYEGVTNLSNAEVARQNAQTNQVKGLRTDFQTTPFTPNNPYPQFNASGMNALVNAFGKTGGTLDYQQPDNSSALMLSSIGNTISGLGSKLDPFLEQLKKKNSSTYDPGGMTDQWI